MKHREPALASLFATFEPLSAAEARLLRELGDGALIRFGDGRPRASEDPERTIRAAFLRTVIVHGAAALGLHEKGLQLAGAAIRGALDLEGCRIGRNLGLLDCAFDAVMVLRGAVIDSVGLDGSGCPGLWPTGWRHAATSICAASPRAVRSCSPARASAASSWPTGWR